MLGSFNKSVPTRLLSLVAVLLFSVLLIPRSGLFVIVLVPLAIHVLVGFKHTSIRDTWRACLSPSMLLLPFCLAFWIRSHQVMSYYLVSAGHDGFVGTYLYRGVIEIGMYEHPDIIRRTVVQRQGQETWDTYAKGHRIIPSDEGWFSTGTFDTEFYRHAWTPHSFLYGHAGPCWGMPRNIVHVGFHFIIPTVLSLVFFVLGIRRLRAHERRLGHGLCVSCGYDLTGNESGVCPECGRTI